MMTEEESAEYQSITEKFRSIALELHRLQEAGYIMQRKPELSQELAEEQYDSIKGYAWAISAATAHTPAVTREEGERLVEDWIVEAARDTQPTRRLRFSEVEAIHRQAMEIIYADREYFERPDRALRMWNYTREFQFSREEEAQIWKKARAHFRRRKLSGQGGEIHPSNINFEEFATGEIADLGVSPLSESSVEPRNAVEATTINLSKAWKAMNEAFGITHTEFARAVGQNSESIRTCHKDGGKKANLDYRKFVKAVFRLASTEDKEYLRGNIDE